MNPWAEVGSLASLDLSKLRLKMENKLKLDESEVTAIPETTTSARLKRRVLNKDYETYNYLRDDTPNEEQKIKDFEVNSTIVDQSTNTLLSILSRAKERKDRRKYLEECRRIEREKKIRQTLEEEKMKNEREKQKHKEKLEIIKQQFLIKKQLAEEKWINENKLRESMAVARNHYDKYLLKTYLANLKRAVGFRRQMELVAVTHQTKVILFKYLKRLRHYCAEESQRRTEDAMNFHHKKVLIKHFSVFTEIRNQALISKRRADEHHSARWLSRIFAKWQRITQDEKLLVRTKIHTAKLHYERNLIRTSLHCLRKWKQHQQETSKQRHFKDQLRSIVKGVLPDFSPPSSDDSEVDDDYDTNNCTYTAGSLEDSIWKARQALYTC